MLTARTFSGGCECGAVRYEITGPIRKVVYCHCNQCQRLSGHFVAATAVATEDLQISEDGQLQWYVSSDIADRGFCNVCGSNLFYRPNHGRHVSVMAGTVDKPNGLKAHMHVHVEEVADYYTIDDGLPEFEGMPDDIWVDNDA